MADACGILASYSCLYRAVTRPTRWLIWGLKEHQSGEGGIENHLYWIDFYEHHTDESGDENKDGDIELPRIVGGGEILFVAEKKGCGGKESYYTPSLSIYFINILLMRIINTKVGKTRAKVAVSEPSIPRMGLPVALRTAV